MTGAMNVVVSYLTVVSYPQVISNHINELYSKNIKIYINVSVSQVKWIL